MKSIFAKVTKKLSFFNVLKKLKKKQVKWVSGGINIYRCGKYPLEKKKKEKIHRAMLREAKAETHIAHLYNQ